MNKGHNLVYDYLHYGKEVEVEAILLTSERCVSLHAVDSTRTNKSVGAQLFYGGAKEAGFFFISTILVPDWFLYYAYVGICMIEPIF